MATNARSAFPVDDEGRDSVQDVPHIGLPLFLTFVLLFLPPATRYLLGTSSNTLGLVAASLLFWGVALVRGEIARGTQALRMLLFSAILVVALAIHLIIAANLPRIPQDVELARAAGSLISLIIIAAVAGVVADWLGRASSSQIHRIARTVRLALVVIGLWSFAGWQPPSPLVIWQPSFPFTEPSHYALVAAPFIIDGCVRGSLKSCLAWLITWLVIAFLNNSLTLVVVVALAAVLSLSIFNIVVMGILVFAGALQVNVQYFTERLDFSEDSNNLSGLVYRQGWEIIYEALSYSRGWGVGFQQLGFAPLNVPTSDLIYRILGNDLNLQDGSFLAAKMVSELGVFGIGLIAMFAIVFIRMVLLLRALARIPAEEQQGNIRFALAAVCGFAVEVFVRGAGYFSSTIVLVIAAGMVLRAVQRQPRRIAEGWEHLPAIGRC